MNDLDVFSGFVGCELCHVGLELEMKRVQVHTTLGMLLTRTLDARFLVNAVRFGCIRRA